MNNSYRQTDEARIADALCSIPANGREVWSRVGVSIGQYTGSAKNSEAQSC